MSLIDYTQPYRLPPNRVWRTYKGGKVLDSIEGRENPEDDYFPEDWIASATRAINAGRENIVEGIGAAQAPDGTLIPMDRMINNDPVAMLGEAHIKAYGEQPQLLVKYLDSTARLQIQAHPSVAWAKKHLDSPNGKTEAWWFLNSRNKEDSWVLFGFQNPPSPKEWDRILREQDKEAMMSCFRKVPVKKGDVLLVEGGVPHAIGPGLFMIEVMEPTDWVVRCEFSHGDLVSDPKSQCMGLEIEEILDMFDYTPVSTKEVPRRFGPRSVPVAKNEQGWEVRLLGRPETNRLEIRRIRANGSFSLENTDRFSILLIVEGSGHLRAGNSELSLELWDKILLPANCNDVTLSGEIEAARCLPPLPV